MYAYQGFPEQCWARHVPYPTSSTATWIGRHTASSAGLTVVASQAFQVSSVVRWLF